MAKPWQKWFIIYSLLKIYIQCNKPEITSVTQKKLLLLVNQAPCLCRRGAAVVRSGDLCVHSFSVVLELCVMDEEGVFVCLFAFDFHWSLALWLLGLPRLQPFVYLTHDMYMRSNTHILDLPSYLRSVWISHKAVVKQVASLTHPTDESFTPVRCVSKGPHTSQKDLLSSVRVLRLWFKFMLV